MTTIRWIAGGLLGGAVGVLVWVLVGYFTNYEVGWIAWGVGFLSGVGVRYVAYLDDQEASLAKGVVASVIAIGSIFAAKFLVYSLLVGGAGEELQTIVAQLNRVDDEAMVGGVADEIVEQMTAQHKPIAWPAGVSPETAIKKSDYPAEVWQAAEARWNKMEAKERDERKAKRMMGAAALSSLTKGPDFGECFSPYDLLWLALAVITAYKVGVGTYGSD